MYWNLVFFLLKSGTSNPYWAIVPPEVIEFNTEVLASLVGCSNDDTLLECLRDAPAEEILVDALLSAPVVDGTTLLDDPLSLITSGQVQRRDSIVGKYVQIAQCRFEMLPPRYFYFLI